jgi:hypothetical protein
MRFRLTASLVLCLILLVLPPDGVNGSSIPPSTASSLLADPKVTQLNADSYSVQLAGVVALTLVAVIYAFAARPARAKDGRPAQAEDRGGTKSDHSGRELPLAAISFNHAPSVRGPTARAGHIGRQPVETRLAMVITVRQSPISPETSQSLAKAHQWAWRRALHPPLGRNEARTDISGNPRNGFGRGSVPDQELWSVYYQSGFSLN